MSHNIKQYIGRQSAWHKLGVVTGEYMTWLQILAIGGLDFAVFKSQLHDGLGRKVDAWGTFRWDFADKKADNREAARFLGAVGKDYTVIHHSKGFEMVDALVASQDGAHYETAGVLRDGQVVWGLADLKFELRVGEDVSRGYLAFCTSYDGSYSHQYWICIERIVCNNTLDIALAEKIRAQLRVKHTKNGAERLTEAHETLGRLRETFHNTEDALNFLAGRRMTREAFSTIMDRLFPRTKEDADGNKVDTARRNNILSDILKAYEFNDANTFPEQKGTSYNLLNAITGYVDHERSTQNDGRAQSAMFGSGAKLKREAFNAIMDASKDLPTVIQRQYVGVARQAADVASLGLIQVPA